MGLLNNGNKEEKQFEKQQKLLAKYNLTELSDPADIESVSNIAMELVGQGALEASVKMSFGKAEESVKISYLRAIMEQNFIIIRQLDRIAKK